MPPSRSFRTAAAVLAAGLLPAVVLGGTVPTECSSQAEVRTIENRVLDSDQKVRKNQCLIIGENARIDGDVEMKSDSVLVLMDTNAKIDGTVWAKDRNNVKVIVQDSAYFPQQIDMQHVENLLIHFHSSDIMFPVGAELSVSESCTGEIGRDPNDAGMPALTAEQVGALTALTVEINEFDGGFFFMNTHFKELKVSESILSKALIEDCVIEQEIQIEDCLYMGTTGGLTIDLYGASAKGATVKVEQVYTDVFFIDIDFDGIMPSLKPIHALEVKNIVMGNDPLPAVILDSFPRLEKLTLEKITGGSRVEMKNCEIDMVTLDEVSTMVVFKQNNELHRIQCGSKTQEVYVQQSFPNEVKVNECEVMLFTNPPAG